MAPTARQTLAPLSALATLGLLAGCAAGTTGTTGGTDAGADSGSTGSGTTSDTPYTDGTYTESGSYTSPNGQETVDVTLTLADDIVTAVEVTGHGDNPDSQRYQGFFTSGIAAEVVGKDIDSLNVSKVGGSSLTSGGFNQALELIKQDALA